MMNSKRLDNTVRFISEYSDLCFRYGCIIKDGIIQKVSQEEYRQHLKQLQERQAYEAYK
jgi:hypothetical protein